MKKDMNRKFFSLLCALVLLFAFGPAQAESGRPEPVVVEGERYVSDYLPGASALYVSGEQVGLDNAYFYGAGYASEQQITDQIPNQYGFGSVVLAAGEATRMVFSRRQWRKSP